jgi:hypothetical protein
VGVGDQARGRLEDLNSARDRRCVDLFARHHTLACRCGGSRSCRSCRASRWSWGLRPSLDWCRSSRLTAYWLWPWSADDDRWKRYSARRRLLRRV